MLSSCVDAVTKMREVLYLPWGKKKSNQRKIEIKFNNLFGKKKKQKSFSSKANKTLMDEDWYFNWPKTNSSQKCRIVQKTKKEVEKKTHAAVLRMIAIKFNNRRIL